jgi:hypothetical protein
MIPWKYYYHLHAIVPDWSGGWVTYEHRVIKKRAGIERLVCTTHKLSEARTIIRACNELERKRCRGE